jgi:hypothetical protein
MFHWLTARFGCFVGESLQKLDRRDDSDTTSMYLSIDSFHRELDQLRSAVEWKPAAL